MDGWVFSLPLSPSSEGLPWRSSGSDSKLPIQRAQIQSLVRELRSHILAVQQKKKKKKKILRNEQFSSLFPVFWGHYWKEGIICFPYCECVQIPFKHGEIFHTLKRNFSFDTELSYCILFLIFKFLERVTMPCFFTSLLKPLAL